MSRKKREAKKSRSAKEATFSGILFSLIKTVDPQPRRVALGSSVDEQEAAPQTTYAATARIQRPPAMRAVLVTTRTGDTPSPDELLIASTGLDETAELVAPLAPAIAHDEPLVIEQERSAKSRKLM